MARGTHSPLLKGISGQLGKQLVVKQYGDKIVLAKYPDMDRVKPSELQKLKRSRFAEAMKYAQSQMRSPEGRALYAIKVTASRRALNVAMSDFYHAPVVKEIDLQFFRGQGGDRLLIWAEDDFLVERVEVHLYLPNGTLGEQGEACLNVEGWWVYSVVNMYPDLTGIKIEATAWDRPGNQGSREVVV
jgi:hypothetical protein